MFKSLFSSLIIILFCSCKDAAVEEAFLEDECHFESPQPINDSELARIPARFLGRYMTEDSLYLNFKENDILQERTTRFVVSKAAWDSIRNEYEIRSGKYVHKLTEHVYKRRILKDSIELASNYNDTLFAFSRGNKAKRVNSNLVLSEKDSIFWTVKLITLTKKGLKLTQIYSKEDRERMDSITKIKSKMIDSTFYIIKPSRKEFKQFFKLKNFGFEQHFTKISS